MQVDIEVFEVHACTPKTMGERNDDETKVLHPKMFPEYLILLSLSVLIMAKEKVDWTRDLYPPVA